MRSVRFYTFGCKLNQAETALLVEDFLNQGYRLSRKQEKADISVVNSCTVTGRSDNKCRQTIRRILRENPETTLIVVGCFPQVQAQEVASISGVDYVLGVQEKLNIFQYFSGPGKKEVPFVHVDPVENHSKIVTHGVGNYQSHTRAFLKIQNGCNNRCSYCIVPIARGPSRSVPLTTVISQAETLVKNGYQEIVLTGIHIGEYGREWKDDYQLPVLMQKLERIDGLARIRLSSLEPIHVTDLLLDTVANSKKICNHFHIPLQSGSDSVLAKMNRGYTTDIYRSIIEKIETRFKNFGLGTDLITGFPGETDAMFQETIQFVNSMPLTYLHVFPFSPRKGTRAAQMENQVAPHIRMNRASVLREIGLVKKQSFLKKWVSQSVEVLLEGRNNQGTMGGFSPEYIRVQVPFEPKLKNTILRVKIEKISNGIGQGKVIYI